MQSVHFWQPGVKRDLFNGDDKINGFNDSKSLLPFFEWQNKSNSKERSYFNQEFKHHIQRANMSLTFLLKFGKPNRYDE